MTATAHGDSAPGSNVGRGYRPAGETERERALTTRLSSESTRVREKLKHTRDRVKLSGQSPETATPTDWCVQHQLFNITELFNITGAQLFNMTCHSTVQYHRPLNYSTSQVTQLLNVKTAQLFNITGHAAVRCLADLHGEV